MIAKKRITILLAIIVTGLQAQTVEKFSIDSGGAAVNTGGIDMLYTIGELNVQEFSAGGIQISEGFINDAFEQTLGITEPNLSTANIKVFPNPASETINIESNMGIDKVEVFNTLGQLLHSTSQINQMDVSQLTAGIYMLKFHVQSKTLTKKIIIEK